MTDVLTRGDARDMPVLDQHQPDNFHRELIDAMRDFSGRAKENFKPPSIESQEERVELRRLTQLQTLILQNLDLLIPDKATRDKFKEKLVAEMGQENPLSDGTEYLKKPTYEQATRDGFEMLVKLYEKTLIPAKAQELAANNLSAPPGLDAAIVGSTPGAFKTGEQFRQELEQGKADLGVKLPDANSKNVGDQFVKLRHIDEWLKAADNSVSNKHTDMLTDFYSAKLEKGIQEGKYPASWRRTEGMDKATWCAAFENTLAVYDQATQVAEALNQLQRSNKGFSTDAFDHLPPGMTIKRDENGGIKVDFGSLLVSNLSTESAENKPKIAAIQQWTDKYMQAATQVAGEVNKDMTKVASFGEIEVAHGQVNPRTGQFTAGGAPAEGMQPFNLMTFDVDVKPTLDQYGAVSGYDVQTHTVFEDVPPYGYLNTMGKEVARVDGKTTHYGANDFVAVQTGGGRVELIQAKDLADWKALQEIKHYGAKGITLTMDVAMLASGGVEFVAAREALARGAAEVGGKILAKEAAENIPRELLQKQMAKGAFEIVLGGTGIFRNAGGDEVPALHNLTTARSAYFLLQAGSAVFNMTGIPKLFGLAEDAAPAAQAAQAARASSVENMGGSWKALEDAAGKAFSYSDKAFLVQFLEEQREAISLRRRHENSAALDQAVDATLRALSGDPRSIERLYQEDPLRGPLLKDHLEQYKKSFGNLSQEDSKKIDEMISKAAELSDSNTPQEKKQQYMNELLKYFRYSGDQISAKQNDNEAISEDKLKGDAAADGSVATPAVREMAALTLALLGRQQDGTWPDKLATRTQKVEYDTVVGYDSESGVPIKQHVGPKQVEQSVTTEEILRVLTPQIADAANGGVPVDRAAALRDAGLISSENYGSILAANINKSDVSTESKIDSIAHLVATINRLRIEEEFRDKLPQEQKQMLKGLAAGASSKDLAKQLKEIAAAAMDPTVRATAQFASNLVSKTVLDQTDMNRYREVFAAQAQSGITPEKLNAWRKADLESKPTNSAGEERRIQAAENHLADARKNNDKAACSMAYNTLLDCLQSTDPSMADTALAGIMSNRHYLAKAGMLSGQDGEKFRAALLGLVAGRTEKDASADARIDAAKLRADAIRAGKEIFTNENKTSKRVFVGVLCECLSGPPDVKVEALKTLATMVGPGDNDVIDAIKPLLSADKEPSETVRLQAIKTLEALIPTDAEKRALFGPLSDQEPNAAAREALEKYHRAQGSAADKDSQLTKETIDRIRTQQNTPDANDSKLMAALNGDRDLRKLLKQNQTNIFDLTDPSRTFSVRGLDHPPGVSTAGAWQVARERGDWEGCVAFEMDAQNAGIQQYLELVGRLAAGASKGGINQDINIGDANHSVKINAREQAILQMGMLISNGEGVSDVYYKHSTQNHTGAESQSGSNQGQFTDAQVKKIWQDRANFLYGRTDSYPGTPSDPWPIAEGQMAHELKKLCVSNDGKVRDGILLSAVLSNLTATTTDASGTVTQKGSAASDEARVELLQGLDALLSHPGCSDETKRTALNALGQSLKQMKADQYPQAAAGMIQLLEKYGPSVFDQFSPEWSNIRDAIKSQAGAKTGEAENTRTPPAVKALAERAYEKHWGSIIEIFDRVPTTDSRQTTQELADLLPTNLIGLQKSEAKVNGHDEIVRNAIEQIFQATKGHPLQDDDPRSDKLAELTGPKYDDAVRLAAAAVLSDTSTIIDVATNSKDNALRTDATKILASMNVETGAGASDTQKQEGDLRKKLGDVLHKDIQGDAMQQALDYLAQVKDPKDANAEIVRQQLYRYADACAAVAIAMSHSPQADAETLRSANELFKRSLKGHGLSDDAFSKLSAEDKGNYNSDWFRSAAADESLRLLGLHQNSADMEQMRQALLEYAKLQTRVGGSRSDAMHSVAIADAIGTTIFEPHSKEAQSADFEVVSTLQKLAGMNRGSYDGYGTELMGAAFGRAANTVYNLEQEKRLSPPGDAHALDAQLILARNRAACAGVDCLIYDATYLARAKPEIRNEQQNKQFFEQLTHRVEARIETVDPSQKFDILNLKFHVAYARALYLQGDEQKAATKNMQDLLPEALKQAEAQFGKDSPQYRNLIAHSTIPRS